MDNHNIGKEFLTTVTRRLLYYKELGEKTFEQLADDSFHYRPNGESNSIAIIVQHMHGNMMSRWTNFLTEDGEKEWRQRDNEFETHSYTREMIIDLWQKGWDCFLGALKSLTEEDLLKTVHIRQEPLSVMDAINRQLAHYPYHIGQIIFIGKLIKDHEWKNLSIPKAGPVVEDTDPERKF
jgi:Protein of unknown function (DUF1572)